MMRTITACIIIVAVVLASFTALAEDSEKDRAAVSVAGTWLLLVDNRNWSVSGYYIK